MIPSQALRDALLAVAPNVKMDIWLPALSAAMPVGDITTERRVAAFIGQCSVESGSFTTTAENLNYRSAARIATVWPSRFTEESAAPFVNNPQALANSVYANRMGNGPPKSGDGWRFRGLGLIQVTGREEYEAFAETVGRSLEDATAWAATPAGAAASAVWFWGWKSLNRLADAWDLVTLTRRINGGVIGLAERQEACEAAITAIKEAQNG